MGSSWRRLLLIDGAILTVWLASVGFVVIYEGGPGFGHRIRAAATLQAPLEVKEQWFGIYYQGQKIGFAHTMISPDEFQERPGVRIFDEGQLRFNLMGLPQQLHIAAQAFVDSEWRLVSFSASVKAEEYLLRWQGIRRGDELVVTLSSAQSSSTERIRDPSGNTLVSGLSSWLAFRHLEIGQWGEIRILNPLSLKPDPVYFHVRRQEPIGGRDALVIETDYHGMSATSWVTRDGEVLKESSPLGWELRRQPQAIAIAVPRAAFSFDLLSTVAVDVDLSAVKSKTGQADRPLEHPERIRHLVVLVEGLDADAFRVSRRWQEPLPDEALAPYGISPTSEAWCVLRLSMPQAPSAEGMTAGVPRRYTAPSRFVQSDDPALKAQAAEIVATLADPWQQALALNTWVYRTLKKQLTMGFPSARDVLMTRTGDCHEHTVLFTALARSRGIPTRMLAGLVYYQGRFYYHAWPEVWIGEWIPMDPTLGQPLADPTHLGLVEAEGEELIGLANFVGKLRLRVVDLERQPAPARRPDRQGGGMTDERP